MKNKNDVGRILLLGQIVIVRIMAKADGYVMVRRPGGCVPFVIAEKDLLKGEAK